MIKLGGILLLLFSQAITVPVVIKRRSGQHNAFNVKDHVALFHQPDLCPLCLRFTFDYMNELTFVIVFIKFYDVDVDCRELCRLFGIATNSSLAGEVCNLFCDPVGAKEFMDHNLLADYDSVYFCEMLKECPIKDNGDASITNFTAIPRKVQQGGEVELRVSYKSLRGTGPGEVTLRIDTQDDIHLNFSQPIAPNGPGEYAASWEIQAAPDPHCDPTRGPCEKWLPGGYIANVAICNGLCGSKFPHSTVYDTSNTLFEVTGGQTQRTIN